MKHGIFHSIKIKDSRKSIIGIGLSKCFMQSHFHKHFLTKTSSVNESWRVVRFSNESKGGFTTPFSVIIPPVIKSAGVTSKAGFQHSISMERKSKQIQHCYESKWLH